MPKDHHYPTRSIGLVSNNNKMVIALAIALGCFAILFPKVFYPMLDGSMNTRSKSAVDSDDGNCVDD